jgi:haloalkane dehalogenase
VPLADGGHIEVQQLAGGDMTQQPSTISADFPYQKQRLRVLGHEMAYVDVGQGDPIVLLHGNPASSYLWRNVLPYLEPLGRCVAPDLIGMGDSDKLPNSGPTSYSFVEHRRYLDDLLQELGVRERVTLVVHDWGSGLGFDWANRHRAAVHGIAYMGQLVLPRGWNDWDEQTRNLLQMIRSPEGTVMTMEGDLFEQVLASGIIRQLGEEELAEYRRPFANPGEDRRPIVSWACSNPLDGEPADVTEIMNSYSDWLPQSSVPKLFVNSEPGGLPGSLIDFCRTWKAQREVTVRGLHFMLEDSPHEIGRAIADWLTSIKPTDK